MSDKKIYEFKIIPIGERYYSEESNYGVFNFITEDDIPEYEEYKDVFSNNDILNFTGKCNIKKLSILSGRMQRLYIGSEYKVTAELQYNQKYKNYQYIPSIVTAITPKSIEQQKRFLEAIITPKQADTILSCYDNIVEDVINNKDFEVDLSLLKGIGEITWKQIKEKIIENYIISDILVLLQPLGVTFNMIQRLLIDTPNPSLLKEQLLDDPYIMTRIRGMGFKTVDGLALKLNPDIRVSAKRTYAFIKYYLTEIGENDGHTWIDIDVLENAVRDNINECIDIFHDIIQIEKEHNNLLYFEGNKVSLIKYYQLERDIFDILRHLDNIKREWNIDVDTSIKEAEDEQGFPYTAEQKEIIKRAVENNVVLISGKAGCVDCDTEYFNGEEWKKISEYTEGEQVLQYNQDGTAELVQPLDYIKLPCNKLNLIQNNIKSINQCVCDQHNLVIKTSKGNIIKKPFIKFKEQHYSNELGSSDKFISSFVYNGQGIDLSDAQIRVMVAVIADGSLAHKQCIFNLKKEHKKERLKKLLKDANINWKERESTTQGYTKFSIYPPRLEKIFSPTYWYKCSQHQLKIIADELIYWDGSICNSRETISSNVKQNADFIQWVYSATGKRARLYSIDRKEQIKKINNKEYIRKSVNYEIHISKHPNISLRARRTSNFNDIKDYTTKDGYKYCFTVPSGMLVLRREGTINITGNCGKTTISRALLKIYKNYSIGCVALSAKASQRITEATGYPASTIHRLLGAQGLNKFTYNYQNPLPVDVLLIDECSMINSEIFYYLLSAVREGTKIIMCGDNRQLPPIGYGNVFSDLLELENKFNINKLTKVLRQAEKSGILSDANKIREGIFPIEKPELKLVSGELQDMVYMFRDSREALQNIAIKAYLKSVEQDNIDDVVIVVPRKQNCINSTTEINKLIQDELIPNNVPMLHYGKKIFKLGAKVIQRVNNYEKNVFNGEIGYITKIWEDYHDKEKITKFEIEYKLNDGIKRIEYIKNELDEIDLAYALTIHLTQGSGYKTVIAIIDNTHYTLLDSCLLYTAITRAKKRCLLLAEPSAFKRCINNNKSIVRQTWLKDFA